MFYSVCFSPAWKIFLESEDGKALSALKFDGRSELAENATLSEELPVFLETKKWLDLYFSGKVPGFMPDLNPKGTKFSSSVWEISKTIPYGKTLSYGEIAGIIAKNRGIAKMSAQAVGRAIGKNPIPIIIPCHRVIGANGDLTGFSCGLDIKIALLDLEAKSKNLNSVPL